MFKGLIRPFKGLIKHFKGLIRPFNGLIRPLKGLIRAKAMLPAFERPLNSLLLLLLLHLLCRPPKGLNKAL